MVSYRVALLAPVSLTTAQSSRAASQPGVEAVHGRGGSRWRADKLSLDDPVRKYIPELPDFGSPLTVRQMLHHTSGLRDWGSLAALVTYDGNSECRMQTPPELAQSAMSLRSMSVQSLSAF